MAETVFFFDLNQTFFVITKDFVMLNKDGFHMGRFIFFDTNLIVINHGDHILKKKIHFINYI